MSSFNKSPRSTINCRAAALSALDKVSPPRAPRSASLSMVSIASSVPFNFAATT